MPDRAGKLPSIFRGPRGGMLNLLACAASVGLLFDMASLCQRRRGAWERRVPTVDFAKHPELLDLDDGMFERLRAQRRAPIADLQALRRLCYLGVVRYVMTACGI